MPRAAKTTPAKKPAPRVVGVGLPVSGRKRSPKAKPVPLAQAAAAAAAGGLAETAEQRKALAAHAQHNPEALAGEALRDLAHERGMARSELATMADTKVREQLRYITAANFGG